MNFFDAAVEGDSLLLDGGVKIPLNAEELSRLSAYKGKTITLGVRPENVVSGNDASIVVSNCENLGHNTLVHGNLSGHRITAKFREWSEYKRGEEVGISFTKKHFFDKETTNAIK